MDLKLALKIDAENPIVGDLALENGTIRLTNTLAEDVAQTLFVGLRLFQGEWFLDPAQGIPYWQSILGHKVGLGVIQQIFRRAIGLVPGIQQVTELRIEPVGDRRVQVIFACLLADGTVLLSENFAPLIVGP